MSENESSKSAEQAPAQRLTMEDPIDKETLAVFNRLEGAKYEIGLQLLELEQERVRLLASAHQVDTQRQRTFEKVLLERGLRPDAFVEVDAATGRLRVLSQKSEKREND